MMHLTSISVCAAENAPETKYAIQYEKLAGTEDAKEFNSCRSELLTYFNKKIKETRSIRALNKSDLDFNNEELVQGYKVWGGLTDYSVNAGYDDVMKKLSEQDYSWRISVRTERTTVYAIIRPAEKNDKNDKYSFCFGKNDKWCVSFCVASLSQGKTGSSKISAVDAYALFDGATDNLNKLVKAGNDDIIKVVYADIGQPYTEYHHYSNGGIVFVNGKAKYLYTFGFEIYPDNLAEDTPESIKKLLNESLSDLYNNSADSIYGCKDIKQLYDYDYIMSLITVYEEYSVS